jgi:hypothetical protein
MASKYVFNAKSMWEKWIIRPTIMQSEGFRDAKGNRKALLNNVTRYMEGDPEKKRPKGKGPKFTMDDVADGIPGNLGDMFDRYEGHQEAMQPQGQFERDTGFWYGAMTLPGTSQAITIAKVFSILYYGGLMVRRGGNWVPWQSLEPSIPIAAAISHSARVLVQLPSPSQRGMYGRIWQWLNEEGSIQPRSAATHDIGRLKNPESVNGIPKYVEELKPNVFQVRNGIHYYMNVALGGNNQTNPFSGNRIDAGGEHGHMYFCYVPATANENGGLLIATEQSAAADTMLPKNAGKIRVALKAMGGIKDQYGGQHDIGVLGRNKYSATGGDDWVKGRLVGTGPDKYIDGMYVDLSQEDQCEYVWEKSREFLPELLGYTGEEPHRDPAAPVLNKDGVQVPPRPGGPAPANAPPGRRPFRPQQPAPFQRPPGR